MATGHGGNLRELAQRAGLDRDKILDFSASVNPLGPPDVVRAVLARTVDRLVHYPDPDSAELAELLARRYRATVGQIVVSNGSSELLFALARGLAFTRAIIPVPSYIDYAAAVWTAGREFRWLELSESTGFAVDWQALEEQLAGGEIVVLGQPNNPTGRAFDPDAFYAVAARHLATTFIVDEAFADFIAGYRSLAEQPPANAVVVCSLTKFYAIPGLRLGFAVASPELATRIRSQIPPWSVNLLAQEAAMACLADDDYARRSVEYVASQRQRLATELAQLPGLYVYPSVTNFLLLRLDRGTPTAMELAERLLREGIAIRTLDRKSVV